MLNNSEVMMERDLGTRPIEVLSVLSKHNLNCPWKTMDRGTRLTLAFNSVVALILVLMLLFCSFLLSLIICQCHYG